MKYNKILIADDNKSDIINIKKHFDDKKCKVLYAKDFTIADTLISRKDIDLLILDWYYCIPESPAVANQVVEALIYNKHFIPIFIYCNIEPSPEDIEKHITKEYPRSLIRTMGKLTPSNPEAVEACINEWFNSNSVVSLAKEWYSSIDEAARDTIKEMYERVGSGFIALLSETFGATPDHAADNIINTIISILQYNILQNGSLSNELRQIIKKLSGTGAEINLTDYELIRNFEMYTYLSEQTSIATGDVFLLSNEIMEKEAACSGCIARKESPMFAVSISAECDYARDNSNLRYHKLVLGKTLEEHCLTSISGISEEVKINSKILSIIPDLTNHKAESLYYLPFVNVLEDDKIVYKNVVLDLQNVIAIQKQVYDEILMSNRICRLRPVYYQHLIRRYSAFSSRIGVPDIPRRVREEVVEYVKTQIAKR